MCRRWRVQKAQGAALLQGWRHAGRSFLSPSVQPKAVACCWKASCSTSVVQKAPSFLLCRTRNEFVKEICTTKSCKIHLWQSMENKLSLTEHLSLFWSFIGELLTCWLLYRERWVVRARPLIPDSPAAGASVFDFQCKFDEIGNMGTSACTWVLMNSNIKLKKQSFHVSFDGKSNRPDEGSKGPHQ